MPIASAAKLLVLLSPALLAGYIVYIVATHQYQAEPLILPHRQLLAFLPRNLRGFGEGYAGLRLRGHVNGLAVQ